MDATLLAIGAAGVLALVVASITVGWILARREHDKTDLIRILTSAGFVAVAITIIAVQANLVVAQKRTILCNSTLIDALAQRDISQQQINEAAAHYDEHMMMLIDDLSDGSVVPGPVYAQTNEALGKLMEQRKSALKAAQVTPLPECR